MKIVDSTGRTWTVTRRLSPWRRVVQPINIPIRNYSRYRVAPPVPEKPSRRERRGKERRTKERADPGGLLTLLAELVEEVVLGLVGIVWLLVVLVGWLVLLPFAIVEFCAQVVVGAGLWLLRTTRCVRSRVDVVARYHRSAEIGSLTVLTVPGFGAAGRLVRAIADEREHATVPFDPHRPDLAVTLASFGGRVERHESAPVVVVPDSRGVPRHVRPQHATEEIARS